LTLATCVDEAREGYRKRKVNDNQKDKGVPGSKVLSFLSSSQDNVEEVGERNIHLMGSATRNTT
jgi:hypothetical protein